MGGQLHQPAQQLEIVHVRGARAELVPARADAALDSATLCASWCRTLRKRYSWLSIAAAARILLKVGRDVHSITLEADAHHPMTDVWTSVGVIVGVGLAWFTGWLWLDRSRRTGAFP
ncbi:MAG: hypothetical protein EXR31_03160 [Betaproteobacteria bacterium]|nr:hypothetical protein [Betaproteobacteria bacterium]